MEVRELHGWELEPSAAIALQRELAAQLVLKGGGPPWRLVAGADASYREGIACGAVVVLSWPELEIIEEVTSRRPAVYPYVPGLLTFREGPALLDCFRRLTHRPDAVLFDGQGIAHPRGLGVAAHLGLILDLPSAGCAKSPLFGRFQEPGPHRGDRAPLTGRRGELLGWCLRTRERVRPVFVSPGHRLGTEEALALVLSTLTRYRLPEPIRRADQLAGPACGGS